MDLADIKAFLNSPRKIVITTHYNPDGDAIGSSLGLCHYLKQKGHQVSVIAPTDYPDFLKWMPGNSEVLLFPKVQKEAESKIAEAELICCLDFNALDRTDGVAPFIEQSKARRLMIDHHPEPDDFADDVYWDTEAGSTAQLVYFFIQQLGDASLINKDIATALYVGIMTDTGSFRFPATTPQTHRVIAELMEAGAAHTQIHENVYDNNSEGRLHLLGYALQKIKVIPEFKTAYIALSRDELKRYNFKKGDTEGFVNYALSVKGTVLAAFFAEDTEYDRIKISFRSKGDFPANALAQKHFQGGGHKNAAGGRSEKSLEESLKKFVSLLPEYATLLNT